MLQYAQAGNGERLENRVLTCILLYRNVVNRLSLLTVQEGM
jgi:hypothetical protein